MATDGDAEDCTPVQQATRTRVQGLARAHGRPAPDAGIIAGITLAQLSGCERDGRCRSRRWSREPAFSPDGRNEMKKTTMKAGGGDESMSEKDVSDLTIKKLTLKTGVKAGRMMAGTCATSCCPKTCHTN
jgi:hypothetical protein